MIEVVSPRTGRSGWKIWDDWAQADAYEETEKMPLKLWVLPLFLEQVGEVHQQHPPSTEAWDQIHGEH